MIKLDSLERWIALPKGGVFTLPGAAARRVRLNVNSPGRSPLYLVDDDGQLVFLAAPDGRDVVEFAAAGDIRITTEADDVSVYSAENEPTFSIIENAEVFTQIANRQARNADLEHMMYLQQQNIERRLAALAAEMETRVGEAYEAGRATVVVSDAPGTVAAKPSGSEPEPGADGEQSGDVSDEAPSAGEGRNAD